MCMCQCGVRVLCKNAARRLQSLGRSSRGNDALHQHLLEEGELRHDRRVSDALVLVQHGQHAAAVDAGGVEDGAGDCCL